MSIYGIMRTSVSGMNAQANRLSAVSDNIANSNTDGYKRAQTEFSTMVLPSGSGAYNSGVVETQTRNLITQQGGLSYTTSTTDLAINGNGFMVVSDSNGGTYMTRAGSFVKDANGNLVNAGGYTLMGYPLPYGDTVGVANGFAGLQPVNLSTTQLVAKPTTEGTLSVNLPRGATTGGTAASISAGVFDPSSASAGDTVTFDISLNGAAAKTVSVVLSDSAVASPSAFQTLLQKSLDSTFGTNAVVAGVDTGSKAISFKTGDTGSQASIQLSGITHTDGDGVTTSKLGLGAATSATAASGDFASVSIGTFDPSSKSIGDRLTFPISIDGAAAINVTVTLTAANTASASAFKSALQSAITATAGLTDVKVGLSGNDFRISLGTASDGATNRTIGLGTIVAADGDGTATSALGLTTAALSTGADRVPPSANTAASTYTNKTSLVTYDDYGSPVTIDVYMTKVGDNQWEMTAYNRADADGGTGEFPYSNPALTTQTLTFDSAGKLTSGGVLAFTVPGGQETTLDISSITQLGADFTVMDAGANGNPPSDIDRVQVSSDGIVSAVFANGSTLNLFKIPLAMVESPDLMRTISGNVFQATTESGAVMMGFGGEGGMGSLVSGAVELSTVDLASELTEMIEAQRGYTANSKAFQTGADILDVLVNLKR
ncbi:flagellar hook-basal body complex protein [Mangrovibrevibacter kandeliae]|uniref:flagellar hook-basal body complex protein n=1 Tax=Mangrovibrevibacter kandeliae TaxID=2968473 RepID=UPI00389B39B8